MQAAAVRRPHFAAGVAFVGASVIAAAAVTPMPEIHLPDVQLPSIHAADVNLAALANPLEVYAQVFQTALTNTNTLDREHRSGTAAQPDPAEPGQQRRHAAQRAGDRRRRNRRRGGAGAGGAGHRGQPTRRGQRRGRGEHTAWQCPSRWPRPR